MRVHHPARQRGVSSFGWLDSRHSFSFGDFYDPQRMGFHALRVINDDRIAGGGGFPTHGHRDMEILTWVLDGALAHEDSTGGKGVIRPGELQRMTAGKGILHSEFNESAEKTARLLQIWLMPIATRLPPSYEQKLFPRSGRAGAWQLVASRDGRHGSLPIQANGELHVAELIAGQRLTYGFAPQRHGWLQVARGTLTVDGQALIEGDALAISDETVIELVGTTPSEVLLFDLE